MIAELENRVVNDVFRRSLSGSPSYLILWSLIIFPTGFFQVYPVTSLSLFLLFLVTTLLRLIPFFFWKKFQENYLSLNRKILYIGLIVQGVLWSGAFVYIMWAQLPWNMKMFMVICTAGLCAGGGVTYSPMRLLAICYVAIMLLPCSFHMALSGREDSITLTSVLLVYFVYLVVLISKGNKEYRHALENELELEKKSRELERISQTDILTGLYTRRHFEQVFAAEWNRAFREKTPIALLMIDIDHFKTVNDTYGHIAGDQALKEFARELQAVFRRCSDVVSRFGGEEFAILLPNTSLENACVRGESFRQQIENLSIFYRGKTIRMTVSIGISGRDSIGPESRQELISEADEALYRAKKEGRNQVQYHEAGFKPSQETAEQFDLFAENF
jgi:diguanylate cyclase (GGDEF)-like protein